jgi:serine protease inhibitor
MNKKSSYNACPVCGKPRGVGSYEFAHGKCMEKRAETDGLKKAQLKNKNYSWVTEDMKKKSNYNKNTKNYCNGKLPKFFYE